MQGFYFALLQCNPIQAFTAAFLSLMQIIPPKLQNRLHGFTGAFPLICSIPAHNTANTQAAYTPPAPRWRAQRQALHLHRYQIPAQRRTLCSSKQPPIIIRYIRVQRCAPCYGSMPARRGQLLPYADRWQVLIHRQQYRPGAPAEGSASPPVQGQPGTLHPAGQSSSRSTARRAARNHWRLAAASLFGLSPDS